MGIPVLKALDAYYFFPSAAVRDIRDDAIRRGVWYSAATDKVQPGWFVIFSWSETRKPNHIGIVHHATKTHVHTVEFNTSAPSSDSANGSIEAHRNGGAVAERKRERNSSILGFVKTYPL